MATAQQSVITVRKGKDTVFDCHSDDATAVFLAGSFNNWSATETPMTRDNSGHWTVSVPLPSGHHEYKFVVDCKWCCEPGFSYESVHCSHCTMNEFGTMNRVLELQ